MPKLPNQKLKLLYLSRIFEERTDRYHGLTLSEISQALGEYGISAERKSLYDDLEALKLCGYDIRTQRDSHVRYYLYSGRFELAELRLLTDAVQSSKFLTPRKSSELVKKICDLGSRYESSRLQKQDYSSGGRKTENEEIYNNIVILYNAIVENKKIRCNCFEWNEHKQRILRKNGDEYLLSPWSLCRYDEFYYLVAYDSDAGTLEHFRVDKMIRVRLTDEKRDGENLIYDADMTACSQSPFDVNGVEPISVRILADNSMAGVVLDHFGTDVTILNHGDKFEFCTKVIVNTAFYSWVLGFGNKMRIISPESVAKEAASIARQAAEMYETPVE